MLLWVRHEDGLIWTSRNTSSARSAYLWCSCKSCVKLKMSLFINSHSAMISRRLTKIIRKWCKQQ